MATKRLKHPRNPIALAKLIGDNRVLALPSKMFVLAEC